MENTGANKTFAIPGGCSSGSITYVWKFWDDSVDVGTIPSTTKKLNRGGVSLPVTCEYCDQYGQSALVSHTVDVNTPPILVGNPRISANDTMFPFNGTLSSSFYDPDGVGAPLVLWYDGVTKLKDSAATLESTGTYSGTYITAVTQNRTVTQFIVDVGNGTTKLDYYLRGYTANGLTVGGSSISNSIVGQTINLPETIIGPDQTITFTTYASDVTAGALQFDWSTPATAGWSAVVAATSPRETDTPAPMPNGSYRSQITVDVSNESPGIKTAYCTVTNPTTGQVSVVPNLVQLKSSVAPVINSISTDASLTTGEYRVPRDGSVHFTGTATDQNNMLLTYQWDFSQPPNITLWGKKVMLRPDQFQAFNQTDLEVEPRPILGNLTVSDRFGAASSAMIQSFVTVQVWPS